MLSSRPGVVTRRVTALSSSPAAPWRLRRAQQQAPRASYGGDGPPPPPPPPPMPEPKSRSNAPVLYDEPPPPPPPPLPRFVTNMPTSRRNAIGASLLFVGALLGFSTVFGSDNDEDAFFGPRGGEGGARGESVVAGPPYRLVDGRAFVRTSGGDILSVGRLPRDLPDADRTLALMGDSGLFLLRLTTEAMRSVDLHSGAPLEAETEFLTRVFASGDWEGALFRVAPSRGEIERIMRENGMDVEKEEAEEEEADAEARARMK